ncbi:MAG: ribonuclease HI [Firmicutes bacterium]|nr:ribonuclease HI [Bacillota bacterium]
MIEIYTDGACIKNPGGPGGWGYVMIRDGKVYEKGGFSPETTNNRMELTAAIEALKTIDSIKQKAAVYTDSQYVKNGITVWIKSWKAHGWERKGSGGDKEIKNLELWQELDQLNGNNLVEWRWVRGHAGNPNNCRADEIATGFARKKSIVLADGSSSRQSDSDSPVESKPEKNEKEKQTFVLPVNAFCLFSQAFIAVLPDLLIKKYNFSKTKKGEAGKEIFRNPYMEISWDETGLTEIKPIITSKSAEITENLKNEEENYLNDIMKHKPIEFPKDFSQWKNIHFQQFLRPILKGMSHKWKIDKEQGKLTVTLLESPSESGEIECGKEYSWRKIPGEKHRNLIITAAENAVVFPDRVVSALRTSKNKVELVSFYLTSNTWNILNCYNCDYLKKHWESLEQGEQNRIVSLIWRNLDRKNRIDMIVPAGFAELDPSLANRLVFQSLFLLHTDAAEIIKWQKAGDKKFKLDVIMKEPEDQEWGADTLVAGLPDWQMFRKPSNIIEKRAVEMAEFLLL